MADASNIPFLYRSSRGLFENPVRRMRHLCQHQKGDGQASQGSSPAKVGTFIGLGVIGIIVLLLGVLVLYRLTWHKRRSSRHPPAKMPSLRKFRRESSRVFDPSLECVSMRDLIKATDGFNANKIVGDGGFGLVYSATLADGRTVAVKRLATDGMQGEREFKAEMETLGNIRHQNLVELLAYCKLGEERVLVYELVENGSLDVWLHERDDGPKELTWERRLKIAVGAACGLSYLHTDCNPHVIHRDIKSSNILLDKDFEPKIADFGLARKMSVLVSHVSTDAAGTFGYMAPEYSTTLIATKQADVYSFGMLMLELASGRRPNLLVQDKSFKTLRKWACNMLRLGYEMDVMDPIFKKKPPMPDHVRAYFGVACDCANEQPSDRPTMRDVYERLSSIGEVHELCL